MQTAVPDYYFCTSVLISHGNDSGSSLQLTSGFNCCVSENDRRCLVQGLYLLMAFSVARQRVVAMQVVLFWDLFYFQEQLFP